ncbi:hypothetical protein PAXINDRAFT_8642 [Paxillus involutus ATCC 200175]|nr:hypothetical protein PAXINDRAFT_8642 [Paxillus involutus ATCC 200175]
MAEIPALRTDRQNWPTWRANLKEALEELGISAYISQTTPNPYDKQVNALTNNARDTSHRDGDVSNGSGRQNNNVPSNNTPRQHQRELKGQGRVERRREEGEKGRKSTRRVDEKLTAATGPGKRATDQTAGGVSLVKPTSSQENVPGTHVDTPSPPPPTPSLPVKQTAPMSRRPTHQRSRNSHVPCNGTCRTREDDQGSRGEVKSRSRGGREPDDEDGDDDIVHHAHVEPQSTRQTANDEAADPSNPNAHAGPTEPAGTSNGPPNGSNKVEGKGGKGEGNKRARGIVDPSSNGENAVPNSIPPTPNPDKRGPPPSMPLKGEKGQRSSGRSDETTTHQIEPPQRKSSTTQPRRMPYDETSNGEGRGEAVSGDDEVEGSEDDQSTSYGDDERRCRREKARDEARDDEEGQQNRERGQTTEERRTVVTNASDEDDAPPPQPPPIPESPPFPHHPALPPPSPIHPERPDDVNTARSNKTAARQRADAMHNPGGETVSPGSLPPSVRLEGEWNRLTSLHVELTDVETNDVDETSAKEAGRPPGQSKAKKPPRDPVGTSDGDTRHPNEPTEPPDEEGE